VEALMAHMRLKWINTCLYGQRAQVLVIGDDDMLF
jgi:hypothetical protein